MSAAFLPGPADNFGPCADPCAHKDCASTRALAAQTCRLCQKPIGFGVYYYTDDEVCQADLRASVIAVVHSRCLEEQAARARSGGVS